VDRLKREFSVSCEVGAPQVNYRESISRPADIKYTHKKQSGGSGQFAEVAIKFEPGEMGSGFEFRSEIKGGTVSRGSHSPGRIGESMQEGAGSVYVVACQGLLIHLLSFAPRMVVRRTYRNAIHAADAVGASNFCGRSRKASHTKSLPVLSLSRQCRLLYCQQTSACKLTSPPPPARSDPLPTSLQVPKEYIPGVTKGLEEMMTSGALAGFPVVDLVATLYDGSYHDVDSSVLAFQIAARQAFRQAFFIPRSLNVLTDLRSD